MDIAQLRTALALREHQTVNRTAAALGLAASSVSERVRRLEEELGVALFVRQSAGMRPTTAGNRYLDTVGGLLDELDRARQILVAPAALQVGAQASVADHLLPPVLADLHRRRPELNIEVRPEPDRQILLQALTDGELVAVVLLDAGHDLGGLGFARPAGQLEHLDLRDVDMVTIAAPDSPLARRRVTAAEIRASGQLIGREPRCAFWLATQRWLGPWTDLTAVGGLAQIREWTTAGQGIAVLPRFTVEDALDAGRLVALDVATPPLKLRLVWEASSVEANHPARELLYALTQT